MTSLSLHVCLGVGSWLLYHHCQAPSVCRLCRPVMKVAMLGGGGGGGMFPSLVQWQSL